MFCTFRKPVMIGLALLMTVAACGGGGQVDTTIGADGQVRVDGPIDNVAGLSTACEGLANLSLALTNAFTGEIGRTDEFVAAAKGQTPGELHDEIDVMAGAIADLEEMYAEIGGNPLTDPEFFSNMTPEQLDRFDAAFDNEEADAAFDAISEWAEQECALGR